MGWKRSMRVNIRQANREWTQIIIIIENTNDQKILTTEGIEENRENQNIKMLTYSGFKMFLPGFSYARLGARVRCLSNALV